MNVVERNRENMLLQAIFEKNLEITQREQEIEMIRQELLKNKKPETEKMQELLKRKKIAKKINVRKSKLSDSNNS